MSRLDVEGLKGIKIDIQAMALEKSLECVKIVKNKQKGIQNISFVSVIVNVYP